MILDSSYFIKLFIIHLGFWFALTATEPSRTRPVIFTPLELDEDGLPIIRVTLHNPENPDRPLSLRFLLDTGCSITALDIALPSNYYRKAPAIVNLTDKTGAKANLPAVWLKRIEVGGVVRGNTRAWRMDFSRSWFGSFEDHPVDGILGMSFLRGTRFTLDVPNQRVIWWQTPSPSGTTLPVVYRGHQLPYVTLKIGNKSAPCLLDTGMTSGLELPWGLRTADTGQPTSITSVLGKIDSAMTLKFPEVMAGTAAWRDIPVDFREGVEHGAIGQDVWSAGPVCFDFVRNRVTLAPEGTLGLPIRRPGRLTLPIVWDRSGAIPFLKVLAVKKDSAMERAGCQVGDVLVRVADLEGERLTRRAVMACVNAGKPHPWLVRRGGDLVTLAFHSTPTEPAGSNR